MSCGSIGTPSSASGRGHPTDGGTEPGHGGTRRHLWNHSPSTEIGLGPPSTLHRLDRHAVSRRGPPATGARVCPEGERGTDRFGTAVGGVGWSPKGDPASRTQGQKCTTSTLGGTLNSCLPHVPAIR